MHHGIEDDGRGGMLAVNVFRQFHDAIRFAAKSTNRCGVVQGIARNGESVDSPETDRHLPSDIPFDGGLPCKGIQGIDENPNAHDGDEPVACVTQMFPQFDETDVERQQHHYNGNDAQYKKQVIQPLFRPLHGFNPRRLLQFFNPSIFQFFSGLPCRTPRGGG